MLAFQTTKPLPYRSLLFVQDMVAWLAELIKASCVVRPAYGRLTRTRPFLDALQRDPLLKALLDQFQSVPYYKLEAGRVKMGTGSVLNREYPLNYYLVKATERAYADNEHSDATGVIHYEVKAFGGTKGKESTKRGFGAEGLKGPNGFATNFMPNVPKSALNSWRFLAHLEVPPHSSQRPTSTTRSTPCDTGVAAPKKSVIEALRIVITENNDTKALWRAINTIESAALPHKELLRSFVDHAKTRVSQMSFTPVRPRYSVGVYMVHTLSHHMILFGHILVKPDCW